MGEVTVHTASYDAAVANIREVAEAAASPGGINQFEARDKLMMAQAQASLAVADSLLKIFEELKNRA